VTTAAASHPLANDPDYLSLKQYLIESTGLAYYADKDSDLAFRLGARLSELKLGGCGPYLSLLKNSEAGESERHLLIGQLTIGETFFFRHSEQFDALRDVVLPELIERNQATRTLRIWSAGCATGAEPYSLAILLKTHFADRIAGWQVQILGTDINQNFLAKAARGQFEEWALRTTPDDVRRRWFSQSGRSWTLLPDFREWVTFQYHNLVEHPYPSIVHGIVALDLILCRNVLIYFDWTVIRQIIGQFHECLVDGGWLAVGHAESNPEVFRDFRTVNVPSATLYQRTGVATSSPLPVPAPPAAAPWQPATVFQPWPFQPGPFQQPGSFQQPWSPPTLPAVPVPLFPGPAPQPAPELEGLALVRRLADEGKWEDAARGCERLLAEDQLNPVAYFYQALVMDQMGRSSDAERAIRRALYLDRSFVFAHYHLARLLEKAGNGDAATQSLNNVRGLLARMHRNEPIAHADGITAEELGHLAHMHLDLLRK
jgi:chemotaxis protein methyltransferase CheR